MGKHDYAFQERDPEVGSANDFVELLWRSLSELNYARAPNGPPQVQYIGAILLGLYKGIMEKKMETSLLVYGFHGSN